jgi:membrane-associated phospholipid phosphatase
MPHARAPNAAANWRIVCLVTLAGFLGVAVAAFAAGLLPGDLFLRQELLEEDTTLLHTLARAINKVGEWRLLLPATLLLFLFSREARRRWWLWAAVQVVSPLIEHSVKFLVGRPRPSGFALGFPSGHTTSAAAFAVIVIYIASREPLRPAARYLIQALAVVVMGLVGWARIALHAHWPTDVLGGFLLGACCAAAGAWWDSARRDAAPSERGAAFDPQGEFGRP